LYYNIWAVQANIKGVWGYFWLAYISRETL
jgi:hypothetical protein